MEHSNWINAFEFAKEACNLSMSNETEFVKRYIIDECEEMVLGLEEIFNKNIFVFQNRERNQYYIDKKGHILIEFRGEKISGALDFITKILEFDKIVSTKSYIDRIEACNKRIQPLLAQEAEIIRAKIQKLNLDLYQLTPSYDNVVKIKLDYDSKKVDIQNTMVKKRQLRKNSINYSKLDSEFNLNYPEYKVFIEEYWRITSSVRYLKEKIQSLTTNCKKIDSYNNTILQYFEVR